jgi:hypothetical protein
LLLRPSLSGLPSSFGADAVIVDVHVMREAMVKTGEMGDGDEVMRL